MKRTVAVCDVCKQAISGKNFLHFQTTLEGPCEKDHEPDGIDVTLDVCLDCARRHVAPWLPAERAQGWSRIPGLLKDVA